MQVAPKPMEDRHPSPLFLCDSFFVCVGWNDWGSEERIVRMLDQLGWRDRLRLAAFDGVEARQARQRPVRVTAAV
jgi:hypothetical protein